MAAQINVLHLVSSLSVGGAERLILGLAERIDRGRFGLHVCSLGVVRGNALQPDFERLLPVSVVGARRFYDPQAVVAVARYIREHRIDIIHTHLADADVLGRTLGYVLGVPTISTLQNEPRDYDRKRFDQRWLNRSSARVLGAQLVAVSRRIRELFIAEWHVPAERITTIFNAVPMEQYLGLRPPQAANAAGPLITTIGRLSPQKAQHLLLDAAARVLAQRPDARFMIVGQGRLEQALKDQARTLGIQDRVQFAGLQRDIPAVLGQTDIFVLPSLWEGLPLTAVEAMAAARPVLLTDVGGNRELVEHGRNGLIVPPGDVAALTTALLDLIDRPEQRVALGQAARTRVRHEFDITTVAEQYEALYEQIAHQAVRRGRLRRFGNA